MNALPPCRLNRFLLALLVGIALILVPGCSGEKGLSLWVGAYFWGYTEETEPEGLANAVVYLWDDSAWAPVENADVSVNGTLLDYYSGSYAYGGDPPLIPGEDIHLEISIRSQAYAATGTMFTEYPAFTDPLPGAVLEAGVDQHVHWNACEPVEDVSRQWIAVFDANDPFGDEVYPATDLPVISREHTFGARRLSAGERLVTINMGAEYPVPDTAWDSLMLVYAGTTVPVTIQGQYMNLSPRNRQIPQGESLVEYSTSVFSYYDGSAFSVTDETDWSCSNHDVAVIGSDGIALPTGEGTATITATWGDLEESTNLTVLPWTVGSTDLDQSIYSVCSSGSLYVVVGRDGMTATSPDGIAWTLRDSGVTVHLNDITWTGTDFVAVGSSGTVITSPDGINWTSLDSGITTGLTGIAWSGSNFVVVDSDGIFTSPDAEIWTVRRDLTQLWSGVACSGPVFVAVGGVGAAYSDDEGVTWNSCSGAAGGSGSVSWAGDRFIIGAYGNTFSTSTDGINWVSTTITDLHSIKSSAGTGGHYALIGSRDTSTPVVILSTDAETWEMQTLETGSVSDLIWTGESYLALGTGRYVLIPPPEEEAEGAFTARSSASSDFLVLPASIEEHIQNDLRRRPLRESR